MDKIVDQLTAYYSTNGTLADVVAFSQMVAAESWKEVGKLYSVIQGLI